MTSASASRVTRSSRSLRLAVLLFAGVLAVVTVLRAQETPPPPAPPAAAGTTPSQDSASVAASSQDAAPAPGDDPAPRASAPASDPRAGPSPARFEPTEKVRADFDVSFPIDI